MTNDNYEIPLSTDWLNSREKFDQKARNPTMLQQFLQSIMSLDGNLVIADLGCGTGSNTLFLNEKIKDDIVWYLVERENELLAEAKRRLKERYSNSWEEKGNICYSNQEGKHITFHFCNETIETFLKKSISLNAVTASALFDLFTKQEFLDLYKILAERKLILYSVLNYTGMSFLPAMESDGHFISLFEAHMSRGLAKGRPMGADTISSVGEFINNYDGSSISFGESNWKIATTEKYFLMMNFRFYNIGISSALTSVIERRDFKIWIEGKYNQINQGILELTVTHQDFIIKVS